MSQRAGPKTDRPSLCDVLFNPKSVALVGLSQDPAKPAGRSLGILRRHGFGGDVFVVNPSHREVQGQHAHASLLDLSSPPDHVYVLGRTERVVATVRDCGEIGARVVTVLADGFAEAGAEGQRRQAELIEAARLAGVRLLGPNSMGLADLHTGFSLTVNTIFDEPDHSPGRFTLLTQSGSMMGGLLSRAHHIGLGLSKIVAVGNEADLTVGEIGELCIGDHNTHGFLLFLETIRDADRMARFAAAAHATGKPVIAYMLGRSPAAQEFAVTHTGALLGDDAAADAFLRDIGVARVHTLEGLLEAATLFVDRAPAQIHDPSIGIVTTTGGGGAAVLDQLALAGIDAKPPSDATLARIRDGGIAVARAPMVDLTMAGAREGIIRSTLEAMAGAAEFDGLVCVLGSSARSDAEASVRPIIEARKQAKPVAVVLTPHAPSAMRRLIATGIPAFRTPETCADAWQALFAWRAPRLRSRQWPGPLATAVARTLSEPQSLEMLESLGIPVAPHAVVSVTEIAEARLPFRYPLVAKVCCTALTHKTDAGGVVVGIQNQQELVDTVHRMKQQVEACVPGQTVNAILLQPHISGLQEVLIGFHRDPLVGPVVMLAPGGIMAEVYAEKAVRLAPFNAATAHEMIAELAGLAPIRGFRGLPKGDVTALAQAIAAFSQAAIDGPPFIMEAEANPVIVRAKGIVAVDALVRVAE
ncbi:MAG: acetate--CoA ligase family protein [Hyphomicrobiaceae bacterium]